MNIYEMTAVSHGLNMALSFMHPVQLGGRDQNSAWRVVEIDESMYFRRKYNRGAVKCVCISQREREMGGRLSV